MSDATFQIMSFAITMVVMLIPALTIIFAASMLVKAAKRFIRLFTHH